MKIYTKTGDRGMTTLIGGERVFKTDERVEAYGTVDELSAFVAMLTDQLRNVEGAADWVEELERILSQMMTVEALLAVGEEGSDKVQPLNGEAVVWLEAVIDRLQSELPPLTYFTIPGGHPAVSACHICRTVCRRAERAIYRADRKQPQPDEVKGWINRLSDYFYLLGRRLSHFYGVEERRWIP